MRVTVVTLAMIAMTYAWIYLQIQLSADSVSEGSVVAQARQIADAITAFDGAIQFQVPEDMATSKEEQQGTFRYAIQDLNGTVLFASRWRPIAISSLPPVDRSDNLYQAEHSQPEPDSFIGTSLSRVVQDRPLVIQVERSNRNLEGLIDTVLDEFFYHGAWLGIPFLVLIILVIRWTIRGTIKPLNRLSEQASAIGPVSTELRLDQTDVPLEILPLVKAMNSVLDRLDVGFKTQREFTADAAHELRTPLAILRAQIDTLDDRDLARSLRIDVDLITRTVTQLLKAAQLDALAVSSSDSGDLCEIVRSAQELMQPVAERDGKTIGLTCPPDPVFVRGNGDAIFNAVRNLMENAILHSGIARSIDVSVNPDGSVSVVDHGPGISDEDRRHLFQRFWRKSKEGIGAGLGLSIVKKTMELHDGSVEASQTPGGGATMTLRFKRP